MMRVVGALTCLALLFLVAPSKGQTLKDMESRLRGLKLKEASLSHELRNVEDQISALQNRIAQMQLAVLADSRLAVEAVPNVDADLRSEPDFNSRIVGRIPKGDTVKVLEYVSGKFCRVIYDSLTGYALDVFNRDDEYTRKRLDALKTIFRQKQERIAAQKRKREADAAAQARAKRKALEESIPSQGLGKVTLSAYALLRSGISYTEACAIIGFWGSEISRTDLGGYTTVMYSWQNPDGSNMNAMFQNGQLVSKAQFGLR